MALICSSLMTMMLSIISCICWSSVSTLEKCVFFAQFLTELFTDVDLYQFFEHFEYYSLIGYIIANIFSHSVGGSLFILLIVFFTVQKLLFRCSPICLFRFCCLCLRRQIQKTLLRPILKNLLCFLLGLL